MFVVTDADTAAIYAVYRQSGELRRQFASITHNRQARSRSLIARQERHVVNLLLVLMVFAIWFLMNHHSLFTLPP